MDFLLRQAAQELHDVVIADLQGLDRRVTALLDEGAEGLGSGDRRGAAEGQIASVGDHVLPRVGRMPADAESEPHRVAAGDRAVLAHAIRILDLAQVRPRLAVDRIHEELLRLFAIFPGHQARFVRDLPASARLPASRAAVRTDARPPCAVRYVRP